MPYINSARRSDIEPLLNELLKCMPEMSAGDVNYILTRIVDTWANVEEPSYYILSQCIAAFECAKMEFYRQRVAPFEESKLLSNGDVYQQREFKPLPAIELPGKDEAK